MIKYLIENEIPVDINYKVELFGLFIILSDEQSLYPNLFEFDKNNDSYINNLKGKFSPVIDEKVLKHFISVKNKYNLHYQNIIELALSLNDNFELANKSSDFFKKNAIVDLCKEIQKESIKINFEEFYIQNNALYLKWINNIEDNFKSSNLKENIINYCGKKYTDKNFHIILLPFETNGGYSFSIGNNIYHCLKAIKKQFAKNNDIFPIIKDAYLYTATHEFLHGIINPLTKDFLNQYMKNNIFKDYYTKSYTNDYFIINESIVRSIVIRISIINYKLTNEAELIEREVSNGFVLVPLIYNNLLFYEQNRVVYKNIDSFYKTIITEMINLKLVNK